MRLTYSNSYSFGKPFFPFIALIAMLAISVPGSSQSPFNGISVQEIPIGATDAATIDALLTGPAGPRCWRIYVCMDDPNWELQAIYGDNINNWITTTTTTFFQAPFNSGAIATNVNPAFFPLEPASVYDSWFTIGSGPTGIDEYNSSTTTITGTPNPFPQFELGNGFTVNDVVGSSIFGVWLPPNSEGKADADNKLLVAQLTTDGIFSLTINLQFRRLNTDGSVFIPVTTLQVPGVFINGTPGAEPDVCPIVFLSVELLSFEAQAADDHVDLNWATASETNNAFFTIERSRDQVHYEEVLRMEGAGTTQLANHYTSIDPKPYEGVSYYRLKQTDTNGDFEYSNPKAVEFYANSNLSIYPNPAHDLVSIDGKEGAVDMIRITGSNGQVVSESYSGDTRQIDLKRLNLSPGVYFVEFRLVNGMIEHQRLVIR